MGIIYRLSSDPTRLYGYNPTHVVVDELAQWTTPNLQRGYAALTSGGGRSAPQVFTITTAGEASQRHDSILGRLLDAGLDAEEIEREPGGSPSSACPRPRRSSTSTRRRRSTPARWRR